MPDTLLILNAGSSSVKFSLMQRREPLALLARGQVEGIPHSPRFRAVDARGQTLAERTWPGDPGLDHDHAIDHLLAWLGSFGGGAHRIAAVGHRVVHGGTDFDRPVLLDPPAIAAIQSLIPLAPLHQPHNLAAIRAIASRKPGLPQVACFDTSFHRTQPPLAQAFALPRALTDSGLRRYGFHGLSYEYIAGRLPELDPAAAAGRCVVAHLGNGASLCAMLAGKSVATTMGFTALDGLVMGTRCGLLDPGVIIHLITRAGMTVQDVQRVLYDESGLLGVSGVSSDMRTLLASDDPHAREAVDLFVYRIVRETASLAGALGGLDAIVFTGGIGENAATVRAQACRALRWLGLELDEPANARGLARISRDGSRVSAWVVPTDEELVIARHTTALLGPPAPNRADSADAR